MSSSIKCIHESFHEQVEKTPDAVCLVNVENSGSNNASQQQQLTYRQVQRRVITLANELRQAGACKDLVVATYMEPSVDYVVAMLAILSAGAGYVPLELAYPSTFVHPSYSISVCAWRVSIDIASKLTFIVVCFCLFTCSYHASARVK